MCLVTRGRRRRIVPSSFVPSLFSKCVSHSRARSATVIDFFRTSTPESCSRWSSRSLSATALRGRPRDPLPQALAVRPDADVNRGDPPFHGHIAAAPRVVAPVDRPFPMGAGGRRPRHGGSSVRSVPNTLRRLMAPTMAPIGSPERRNPGPDCSRNSVTRGYVVGVRGFEPPASTSRTWRANQAALHPVAGNDATPRRRVLPRAKPQLPVRARPRCRNRRQRSRSPPASIASHRVV